HCDVRPHAGTRDAPDRRTSRRPDAPRVVPSVHVERVSADASMHDRDRGRCRAGGHPGASMSGRPAVFLDRDGTIIEEVGYLDRVDRVQLFPWSVAAIRALNAAKVPIVLITNQSGVARGFFTESVVDDVHRHIGGLLAAGGAHLDAYYYCPHHRDGKIAKYAIACDCRKPGRGLVDRAARELGVDGAQSFTVGDR